MSGSWRDQAAGSDQCRADSRADPPKADRHRPGTQHGFRRHQPLGLRLGLHALCRLAGFHQAGEGLALEIGGIEDRHQPVAGPPAQGDLTALAGLLAAVKLGPQDVNRVGALAGEDAELSGLGKAAPERQGRTPNVHAEGGQDRIGAAVAMTRDQVDVVAAAAAMPGPPPGADPASISSINEATIFSSTVGPSKVLRNGIGTRP